MKQAQRFTGWLGIGLLGGCGPAVVDSHAPPPSVGRPPGVIQRPESGIPVTPAGHPGQPDQTNLPRLPAAAVIDLQPDGENALYHQVKKGDNLTAIARRYGTTVERLLEANGLARSSILQPGQLLYVPDAANR